MDENLGGHAELAFLAGHGQWNWRPGVKSTISHFLSNNFREKTCRKIVYHPLLYLCEDVSHPWFLSCPIPIIIIIIIIIIMCCYCFTSITAVFQIMVSPSAQ